MEKPPLEKVIEKLEKLDIRAWKLDTRNCFITKTNGLTVYIFTFSDPHTEYKLEIVNNDRTRAFSYNSYNKQEKDLLKGIYEKICEGYDKIQEEEWKEMINNLLSE